MAGTFHRYGPAFLSNATANVYTPPASNIYQVIDHIHVANKTILSATFSLYIGGTGAAASGTELFKDVPVPANSYIDYYPMTNMMSTDFLTGIASAASTLVITVETEQFVIPS